MSNALRFGLMGFAKGGMEGLLQQHTEAKTERLRQARAMEEKRLREDAYRTELNITPPKEQVSEEVGPDGSKQQVRREWKVDAEGPSENWKGEFVETGRQTVPKASKEVERKVGDEIKRYRVFEDGTEEEIASAPRYREGGSTSNRSPVTALRPDGKWGKWDVDRGEWVTGPGGEPLEVATPPNGKKGDDISEVRDAIKKEIADMDEKTVRTLLGDYGIAAGPDTSLASAKRELVDKLAEEEMAKVRGRTVAASEPRKSITPESPAPQSPYPDGTRLQGPDGMYVVRNGVPVKES